MSNRRMQTEILLGVVFTLIAAVVLLYLGFREETALASTEQTQLAESIEVGAKLFTTTCAECHGEDGKGGKGPPLNDAYFFTQRLDDMGWGSTLEDYIVSTIAAGRLVSTRPEQYPGGGVPAMPAWSQDYGGPLRNDQIRTLAKYILNWEATALGQVEVTHIPVPGPSSEDPVVRGRAAVVSAGCVACHTIPGMSEAIVGPPLSEIGSLAATRIEGLSPEEYLRESIINPSAYVVEGFNDGIMPQDFGQKLLPEQMDDIITFLMTLK
jgi:mono/diheme cytochrome c family protein